MKKVLSTLAMVLLLAGCAKQYDDSGLKTRIDALETRVNELETSISGIQSAIGDGVFAQKVDKYVDPATGRTIGITVTYTNGNVVYFTITPTDPAAGPVFSVIRNGAGELCWALDGVILQVNGKDVPVYQTPVFSIDDEGNLIVEVDGEETNLGPVTSGGATLQDGIFTDLAVTDEAVVLTLSDGSVVKIPFAEPFRLVIDKTEFIYDTPGPITIPYTVSGATDETVVGVTGYLPLYFSVNVTKTAIEILPLVPGAQGHLMAYADSRLGLTSIVDIDIEPEMAVIADESLGSYIADPDGEVFEIPVVSNVDITATTAEDWITIVQTRAALHGITVSVAANAGAVRSGKVNVLKKGTDKVLQEISILQPAAVAGPKDLGKNGTANCYIVTAAGEYKFAAVKGNSTESAGAVAKAEILWETVNTSTAPEAGSIISAVAFEDGYVSFTATGKSGNALIAAKDASENILWSWHIWIPATEIKNIADASFYPEAIMDRNLGALEAATTTSAGLATYGMYYQWGRKDPFPGKAIAAGAEFSKVDGPLSTEYAIAHPTEIIAVSESDSAGNWNEADLPYLWEKEDGAKEIYDPCPAGYKVPAYNASTGLWINSNEGWTYSWDANNCNFGENVFPVCGWLSRSTSLSYESARLIIHSATAHTSASRDRNKIIRQDKGGYYYANYYKVEAGSVRCVAE